MSNYSELDFNWVVSTDKTVFTSPEVKGVYLASGRASQQLIFNEVFSDGIVSADVCLKKKIESDIHLEGKNAALVFRFQNPQNFYFAGLGSHNSDSKFSIYRVVDGQIQRINSTGSQDSVKFDEPYRIEVRCTANKISLAHNGIVQLQVFDETFLSGQWGLRCWSSLAEFRRLVCNSVKPKCFVIMPFSDEFDAVFAIIKQTMQELQYECVRADERFLIGPIASDINYLIEESEIIIADLTGRNPNVYYEIGYAYALRKSVVQIAQSAEDLAFDVRHLRTFTYDTRILGDRKLAHNLREAIRANKIHIVS